MNINDSGRAEMARFKPGMEHIVVPDEKIGKGVPWAVLVLLIVVCLPAGILLTCKKVSKIWRRRKLADYRVYKATIGSACQVDIRKLAKMMGKVPSLVMADLQAMIDKGYIIGRAYIDRSKGLLIMEPAEGETVEFVVDEAVVQEIEKTVAAQAAAPVQEPAKEQKPAADWSENAARDELGDMLREIRAMDEQIEDPEVSRRINRIGELTASIFTVVREKPERADEVRKFMKYYLPTTLKLLKSYSLMEKQSYQGENIAGARKKIEGILDSLISAFEQQQDRLFHSDALDVDAEVEVLEKMMAKDGLVTPKGADLRATLGGK